MDSNAPEAVTARVWHMSVGRKAEYVMLALVMLGIGAFMGGGTILFGEYQVFGVVVIAGTAAVATWSALQLRSSLRVTNSALIVRTATKVYEIPLQQLTRVSGGYGGIYIHTSDGRRITSQVAGTSMWSDGSGLETRASRIAEAINDARQAAHLETGKVAASAGADHHSAVTGEVAASSDQEPAVTGEVAAQPTRGPSERLAKTMRLAVLMIPLGAACLIGWFIAVDQVEGAAQSLLAHGSRVEGTVTDWNGSRIEVRFPSANGKPVTVRINIAQYDKYYKGEHVTVVYDPGHLDRAMTIREDGESRWSGDALSALLVVALFLLVGGISIRIRGRRQLSRLKPSTS
jgi:hypothetical protein